MRRILEICVTDFQGAWNAYRGGANRVELCSDIANGGVTPSAGLIRKVCAEVGIPVHVLIRPYPGHFSGELDIMLADIGVAKTAGAAGVVVGILNERNGIDTMSTKRLLDHARPMSVTFHRAIDVTPYPVETLAGLIELGVDRVLTAGGPGPARGNIETLRIMRKLARDRLTIMVGGGVTLDDIPIFIRECNLEEFHIGSWVTEPETDVTPFGVKPAKVFSDRVKEAIAKLNAIERVADL